MSSTDVRSDHASELASVMRLDGGLEVIGIPVSTVDLTRDFYGNLGWRLDVDRSVGEGFRWCSSRPLDSGCSIQS